MFAREGWRAGEEGNMNSNKIDRFICEIKTYGDDITFDIRMGSIVFSSKKTNFKNIEEDLLATASYYGLTIGLLSQNTCEFYEIKK